MRCLPKKTCVLLESRILGSLSQAASVCPISGVFGAGKTLSAAAMIAGLLVMDPSFFFLIAGCIGSQGYWQSLATRESKKQHQWYCIPKESQVPIHYDLRHHNLCMTERMVH